MITLIIQISISVVAAVFAGVELLKEFRKRQDIAKKEAHWLLIVTIVYAILTIMLSVFNFFDNREQQKDLKDRLNKIDRKNDRLENQIAADNKVLKNNVDTNTLRILSNSATKALAASAELRETSGRIRDNITGTDQPPYLEAGVSDESLNLVLTNKKKLPAYATVSILNYSELEKCNFSKSGKYVDLQCFKDNLKQNYNQSLLPFIQSIYALPKAPRLYDVINYKVEVFVYLRSKVFLYQMYFSRNANVFAAQVRILMLVKKKFTIYKTQGDTTIDWDNQFNDNYIPSSFYNYYQ